MRLTERAETAAFREDFRTWVAAHRPRRDGLDGMPGWARAWQRRLFDAGWLMPAWAPEYGGRSATAEQEMAYFEEVARANIQRGYNGQGLSVVAPALLVHGNPQ